MSLQDRYELAGTIGSLARVSAIIEVGRPRPKGPHGSIQGGFIGGGSIQGGMVGGKIIIGGGGLIIGGMRILPLGKRTDPK
jgi:hypothetical protein